MQVFRNLDSTKQKRILNAALKEFTKKGFDRASTNQIVKEAGIGKGMLFYYFTSKKELYFYLIDYCIRQIESDYLGLINENERDLFKRLKGLSKQKWKFLLKYPDMINFIGALLLKSPDQLEGELKVKFEDLQVNWHSVLYGNLDTSLFRDDLDISKAMNLILWALQGYEEDLKVRLRDQELSTIDYELHFKEFDEYLSILKKTFYKESEV